MIYREFLKKLNTYEFEKTDKNRNNVLLYILEDFDASENTLTLINQMMINNRTEEIIEWVQTPNQELCHEL